MVAPEHIDSAFSRLDEMGLGYEILTWDFQEDIDRDTAVSYDFHYNQYNNLTMVVNITFYVRSGLKLLM